MNFVHCLVSLFSWFLQWPQKFIELNIFVVEVLGNPSLRVISRFVVVSPFNCNNKNINFCSKLVLSLNAKRKVTMLTQKHCYSQQQSRNIRWLSHSSTRFLAAVAGSGSGSVVVATTYHHLLAECNTVEAGVSQPRERISLKTRDQVGEGDVLEISQYLTIGWS